MAAEAAVERAVGVVAREREVDVDPRRVCREPGGDDLAVVGLDSDRFGRRHAAAMSVVTIPPAPKLGVRRAVGRCSVRSRSRCSQAPRGRPGRRRRSRRRGVSAASRALSSLPPKSVMAIPSVPKLVSRLPAGSWRVSAKSRWQVLPIWRGPAVTIPPSGWISDRLALSDVADRRGDAAAAAERGVESGGVVSARSAPRRWSRSRWRRDRRRSATRAHLVGVVRLGLDVDLVGLSRRGGAREREAAVAGHGQLRAPRLTSTSPEPCEPVDGAADRERRRPAGAAAGRRRGSSPWRRRCLPSFAQRASASETVKLSGRLDASGPRGSGSPRAAARCRRSRSAPASAWA